MSILDDDFVRILGETLGRRKGSASQSSPRKPAVGTEHGDTHPHPVETTPAIVPGGIAGEGGVSATGPEDRATEKPPPSADGLVQMRLRLPAGFANNLRLLPSRVRWYALYLALEGTIGGVWRLQALTEAVAEVRRSGALLLQSLRQIETGGIDTETLCRSVRATIAAIDTLRAPRTTTRKPNDANEGNH